ncbi:MAG: HAMP domain-containing sensor histidine kinase [Acidimicrobiales bacterium]
MIDVQGLETEIQALRSLLSTERDQHREFARRAGHDLAAPLRGLRSLTSFLREDAADGLDGDALELLERIDGRVVLMEQVVQSLTAFARSGDRHEAPRPTTLADIIDDVIVAVGLPARFRCEVEASGAVVHLPLVAIGRVVERVVENAWHHANPGDLEGTITIGASIADGFATVTVSDDGPGMDPRTAAHAFDPFFTGPPPPDQITRRSGLGLATASATAAAHGGSLAIVDHRPGHTVVAIRWPVADPLPFA